MTSLYVLDVGHGNCAIIQNGSGVAVVDAPTKSQLLDTLRDMNVKRVDAAFISHSDKDHLAGIVGLLSSSEFTVGTVYLNPDSGKTSSVWFDLLAAVHVAERKGTVVHTSLTSALPGSVVLGEATINIVAPSASLALRGVGGVFKDGRQVTANSMSAVLRVETSLGEGVLLAGDMDEIGLDDAVNNAANLRARVLVFPHHGGAPNGDVAKFVDKLLTASATEAVVFSNGRNRYDLPQREIVEAVGQRGCSIACTQLSQRCSDVVLGGGHLEKLRAKGRGRGQSCAGSISFALTGGAKRSVEAGSAFRTFVETTVPTAMCRGKKVTLN